MQPPIPAERLYMPELDGLRFLAFLAVFLHHLPFPPAWTAGSEVLARVHAFGWMGVDVFLVLSAYLLSSLAVREWEATGSFAVGRFFLRRVLRIWPLYFFGLVLGFALYPAALALVGAEQNSDPLSSLRDHLIPFSLFFGNLSYSVYPATLGLYKSLWTISLEEQFYLVFPVLMILLLGARSASRTGLFLLCAVAVSLLTRIYYQLADIPYPTVWASPLSRLEPLAIGIALGLLMHTRKPSRPLVILAGLLAVCGVMLVSAFPQLGVSAHTIWQLLASAVASGAILVFARSDVPRSLLGRPAPVALGKLSFGLYVYHSFTVDAFTRAAAFLPEGPLHAPLWLALALLCFAITVLAALASYEFLEKPFLKRKRLQEIVPSRPTALLEAPRPALP